ncbi:NUDIX domain-containing protein [soil metagenome]
MTHTYDYPRPAVTTDVVLFTIDAERLRVLLVRRGGDPFRGCWAFPGGFIELDEDLIDGARRELAEETGVTGVYLEQLYTFGTPNRDPRGRVISVVYYALAPEGRVSVRAGSDAAAVQWFPVNELPPLAFDHDEILAMTKVRLATKLGYSTIALQLMPEKFTLSELQSVYEVVLGRTIDKRNFRKRMLAVGSIEPCQAWLRRGNHRPARLYRATSPEVVDWTARAGL